MSLRLDGASTGTGMKFIACWQSRPDGIGVDTQLLSHLSQGRLGHAKSGRSPACATKPNAFDDGTGFWFVVGDSLHDHYHGYRPCLPILSHILGHANTRTMAVEASAHRSASVRF
jgi:hypothetical protein